mmetsp:Transcript_138241/g.429752  ORF Transcript_138241/g.429752 Transcript_138241/m.429752 type:complete len:309 (-) Transcript_138241:39-965(-)
MAVLGVASVHPRGAHESLRPTSQVTSSNWVHTEPLRDTYEIEDNLGTMNCRQTFPHNGREVINLLHVRLHLRAHGGGPHLRPQRLALQRREVLGELLRPCAGRRCAGLPDPLGGPPLQHRGLLARLCGLEFQVLRLLGPGGLCGQLVRDLGGDGHARSYRCTSRCRSNACGGRCRAQEVGRRAAALQLRLRGRLLQGLGRRRRQAEDARQLHRVQLAVVVRVVAGKLLHSGCIVETFRRGKTRHFGELHVTVVVGIQLSQGLHGIIRRSRGWRQQPPQRGRGVQPGVAARQPGQASRAQQPHGEHLGP